MGMSNIRMFLLFWACQQPCSFSAHFIVFCSHFSPLQLPHPHRAFLPNLALDLVPHFISTPQIILNAKCHAIRDAQILEKQLIQKELDAEEKRLDQMMEVERQKSIQRQEELDRKRREERIR